MIHSPYILFIVGKIVIGLSVILKLSFGKFLIIILGFFTFCLSTPSFIFMFIYLPVSKSFP